MSPYTVGVSSPPYSCGSQARRASWAPCASAAAPARVNRGAAMPEPAVSAATWLSDEDLERLSPEQSSRLNDFLEAIDRNPRDVAAYSHAGRLLDSSGDPRRAIDFLRRAVAIAPRKAVHYDELAHALRRAALSVDAHKHRLSPPQRQKAERVVGDEDVCYRRAKPDCFELQHYTDEQLHIAESDFLRRTERDSSDSHGLALLAQLYRNRSCDAAVKALRLEPSRPTAYVTLARLLPRGGAIGAYRRALTLVPSHPELYREMGGALVELRCDGHATAACRDSNGVLRSPLASLIPSRMPRFLPVPSGSGSRICSSPSDSLGFLLAGIMARPTRPSAKRSRCSRRWAPRTNRLPSSGCCGFVTRRPSRWRRRRCICTLRRPRQRPSQRPWRRRWLRRPALARR